MLQTSVSGTSSSRPIPTCCACSFSCHNLRQYVLTFSKVTCAEESRCALHISRQTMDALDTIRRDPQRRFTTIEGYREAGNGIYLVPGSGITAIALEPNPREFYDPEWGRLDDRSIRTRCSRQEQLRLTAQTLSGASSSRTLRPSSPKNPFLLPEEAEQNPFADPRDLTSLPPPAPVLNEKPFHIFSKRQKWTVVGIIGTAGLFSGLSSNIYFPSLDAISKVSTTSPYLNSLPYSFVGLPSRCISAY